MEIILDATKEGLGSLDTLALALAQALFRGCHKSIGTGGAWLNHPLHPVSQHSLRHLVLPLFLSVPRQVQVRIPR
jgi:hypothetical protein